MSEKREVTLVLSPYTAAPERCFRLLTKTANNLVMILFTIQLFSLVQIKERRAIMKPK